MRLRLLSCFLILLPVLLQPSGPAAAQDSGIAEIHQPSEGQTLGKSVIILGSAAGPAFAGYELAYAPDPNPTGGWLPIADRFQAQVHDSRLAIWDTNQIPPGRYQLRLTVYTKVGDPLTATVTGLHLDPNGAVQQQAGTGASADADQGSHEAAAASATGGENSSDATIAAVTTDQSLLRILGVGAGLATALLATFGLYTALRPRLREYAGRLRTRGVHRRLSRRSRRDRGR